MPIGASSVLRIPGPLRTLGGPLRATLSAALDAFVVALQPLAARLRNGGSYVAVPDETGITLHTIRPGRGTATLRLAKGEQAPEPFHTGTLDLRLPARHFLTRTLRLPAAGRDYLTPIIEHRMERLTPWRPEKVIYAFDPLNGVDEDGTFAVELCATSVEIVAPYLADLEAVGLVPTALGSDAEPLEKPLRLDLYKGRPESRGGPLRARVRRVCGFLFAFMIPACLISIVLVWSQEASLTEAEARIAALRGRLGQNDDMGRSRGHALLAGKRPENAMIVLIDRLSRALPDGTVLRELDIDEGKVRLVGRSIDAPALIARIEAEAGLKNPRFAAPVIRDADKRDGFDLIASRTLPEAAR